MRRRFIAFLTLIISAVIILIGNFATVFTQTKSGIEFANGQQYVYKISSTSEDGLPVDIEDAAKEMNRRLKNANVNYFDINTEGDDQIRVTFTGTSASESEHIRDLLSYNATFSLCTTDDEQQAESEDIFKNSVARVEYRNQYPIIVIPISDSTRVETIRNHATTLSKSSEDGDDTGVDYSMVVLWANKVEGDDFASAMDPDNPDYLEMQEKVLLAFSSVEENFYYDDSHKEICYVMSVNQGEDGSLNPVDVRKASIEAQHKVNLFNAGALDYQVNYLYSLPADAYVENLIKMNETLRINWNSKVLLSSLVAFVLVSIALVVYYRLNSLVAIVTIAASLLSSLAIFNLFGVEFSLGAIIGLIVTAFLGLFSNIFYFEKLKNELYRGRTLKKANSEASKHSLLPIVDGSVVVLLASLITFFIGEPMVRPFAVMGAIGAVVNLLFTLLGTKGLMWLLTNDTSLQTKKRYFGVDEDKIPNTANEEKQTYFGPYEGRDFTKKSSTVGVIAGLVSVIGITCALAFNYTIGTFNYSDNGEGTRIQLTVEDTSDISDVETLASDLEELGFKNSELLYASEVSPSDKDITLNYYIVVIDELPDDDALIFTENPIYDDDHNLDRFATIQTYLENKYQAIDSDAEVKVLPTLSASRTLNVWRVGLALVFGLILSGIYLLIRYGFSKALTSVVVSTLSSFLALAFFIILRISFNDLAGLALLGIMNISLLSSMFFFVREKEMALENAETDHHELVKKAIASAFGPMAIFHSIAVVLLVVFMALGPASYEINFAFMILGSVISLLMNAVILGPLYYAIKNSLKKARIHRLQKEESRRQNKDRKPKKKKKMEKPASKGSEPEEAIFIGIND